MSDGLLGRHLGSKVQGRVYDEETLALKSKTAHFGFRGRLQRFPPCVVRFKVPQTVAAGIKQKYASYVFDGLVGRHAGVRRCKAEYKTRGYLPRKRNAPREVAVAASKVNHPVPQTEIPPKNFAFTINYGL